MPPPNLQGLNIVQPTQSFDSQDLLSGQPFPDLSAQLDLWTNLSFTSDEPPVHHRNDFFQRNDDDEEEDTVLGAVGKAAAIQNGHVNVVTGTNVGNNLQPSFDFQSFLAGIQAEQQYSPAQQQQTQPGTGAIPSLAQLLALHAASYPPQNAAESTSSPSERPTKRSRSRKASVSAIDSPEDAIDTSGNPLSVSEDKRRRNTAASARFRLKKKEREAALEGKAKELETRVSELERECEGLRRENGWLKGLVVGVTGAVQQAPPPAMAAVPPSNLKTLKRSRDDE